MCRSISALQLTPLVVVLASCAGGGTGAGVVSAPTPPTPTPTPSATPPAGSVLKPEVIALQDGGLGFVTYGVAEVDTVSASSNLVGSKDLERTVAAKPGTIDQKVSFRFDQQTGNYAITLPDGTAGTLLLKYLNGSAGQFASSTGHVVVGPNGDTGAVVTMPAPFQVGYPYTYSHYGYWEQSKPAGTNKVQTFGWFAYGIEAPSSAVPVTGTASFHADIHATSTADPFDVGGTATLKFDFGQGTLSGAMHPTHVTNGFYPSLDYDYGSYDFAQTIYSAGSSRYSGAFARNGVNLPGSFFEGSLTGPYADETVARFVLPFERGGVPGSLSGIWIGKKD